MFYECESLLSIFTKSEWNLNHFTNLSYMFCNCISLRNISDISKWDTSNLIDSSDLFFNCRSLIYLPDISKWNIKNVKNKECIFANINERTKVKYYNLLKDFMNKEMKIIYKKGSKIRLFGEQFINE